MSRSGYSEDCDGWDLVRWRGAVNSAIKGKRGQQLLKDLVIAMDATPIGQRKLIQHELVNQEGSFCALGVVGNARGINLKELCPFDSEKMSKEFDAAEALIKEIEFMNDEFSNGWNYDRHTNEADRWHYMRQWVEENIVK